MPPTGDAIEWYERHAEVVAPQYEALSAGTVHAWLESLLPPAPGLLLDMGAGTGRDAAWFASKGHQVVAIEPSGAMRRQAQRLHCDERIRWLDDRLPALATTLRVGLAPDVILLSGVWQHLAPADRPRAFRSADPDRRMHPVSLAEIERLAREHGLAVVHAATAGDAMGRPEVTWTQVALWLPDDGTGALPLLWGDREDPGRHLKGRSRVARFGGSLPFD